MTGDDAARHRRRPGPGRDIVAIVLAVGVCTGLNGIVLAVCWDAITSQGPGLSENATQILTGAFGGMFGILGTYIGLRSAQASQREQHDEEPPPAP